MPCSRLEAALLICTLVSRPIHCSPPWTGLYLVHIFSACNTGAYLAVSEASERHRHLPVLQGRPQVLLCDNRVHEGG